MSAVTIFRGTIFHTPADAFQLDDSALSAFDDGGLAVRDGRVVACGEYADIRAHHPDATAIDWRSGVILPGFIDTHTHFPQLRVAGSLGRDLLGWLEAVALPEEAAMADVAYATSTATQFVRQLVGHGTTTAMVFGAHFAGATAALFDAAEQSGVRLVSGLVCADRLLRDDLRQTPSRAYEDNADLIRRYHKRGRLLYAVTPRFAVSASEAMLEVCQTLVREFPDVRVQSHLNENPHEIAQVAKLFPWAADYLGVYERYALTGPRAVMAHDVHATAPEIERLAASRTSVAHCPSSNSSLGSGVFPMKRHLAAGVHVAMGTDIGAGVTFSIAREALEAYLIQNVAPDGQVLRPCHLLYLATAAGAKALGLSVDIGDFAAGKAADFVCVRPRAGSLLAGAFDRAREFRDKLGFVFSVGRPEDISEVRVSGDVVFAAGSPRPATTRF